MSTQPLPASVPGPRLGPPCRQQALWIHRCPSWCDSEQCHETLAFEGYLTHTGVLETVHSASDAKTYVVAAVHLDEPISRTHAHRVPILYVSDTGHLGDELGDMTPLGALALAEALQRSARRLLADS